VAEKLKRRWILVDIGKLSVYSIQKRMLNLKEQIGDEGKSLKHKPFTLFNVGLYDYKLIEKLGEDEYKNFVLDLFQVNKQNHKINGLKFDGKLFGNPVKVFDRKGFLTEDYVKDLHETVGESITDAVFVICPATNVEFIRTSIDLDGKRYYILKVPYSIIDELHSKPFKRLIQPNSASKINEIIDSVGFDFIYPPDVKREFYTEKRGGIFPNEKDYVIHITKIDPIQITNNPVKFENDLEALAGVFIDYDYDNQTFNLGKAFFADEVLEKGDAFKIRIESEKCGEHICVIYLDILGNEKIEVIKKSEFKSKK
jgi:site-specific DNA-methyltransferase (adenine-specific)/adenine-specific DNA-methyltransferase